MKNLKRKTVFVFLFSIMAYSLSGCSTIDKVAASITEKKGVDYQNNKSIKDLEIPPDLTTPEFDTAFALPKGTISAASLKRGDYQTAQKSAPTTIKTIAGKTVVKVNSPYPVALVSTEKALQKMKFKTLSKSAAGDVITAKYMGDDVSFGKSRVPSFMEYIVIGGKRKRLLAFNGALEKGADYRITIKNENNQPIVRFARADEAKITEKGHAKIAELLASAFRQ